MANICFTLSAADTIWRDFFRACNPTLTNEDILELSSAQRLQILNEYPDIAVRHFLMSALGEITDFFWRVEFQNRGSPHIYGLLWRKDAPDVLEESQTENGCDTLATFIDKYISASVRPEDELNACECSRYKQNSDIVKNDILMQRPPLSDINSDESNVV